ncbi:MAG: hypothetical protein M3512_15275 [Bacteroidota bacterium]|nr:hypothetical protein [Bacteroidota bacterium]
MIPNKIGPRAYWQPVIPIELLGIIGRNKNHFEIGIGYTLIYSAESNINLQKLEWEFDKYVVTSLIPFRFGYRFQKPAGGLFFRVGYTPILDFAPQREKVALHLLFGGISIGKSF